MKNGMDLQIIQISLLLAVSIFSPPMSGALTTFGKTPQNQNQNPPPPPTPIGKARECKVENDCAGIPNTTCTAPNSNGRTQCLCGDYSAPVNGVCTNKFKALHKICNSNSECIEDAHCVERNNSRIKRCYCQDGFYEENYKSCSGCSSIFNVYTTTLLMTMLIIGRFYI